MSEDEKTILLRKNFNFTETCQNAPWLARGMIGLRQKASTRPDGIL
jgi:hypothetical protein